MFFFCKYWERLVVKNKKDYLKLFIGYEANKYILKILIVRVILVAIENLLHFTPSQAKGKFLYPLRH